jgi:predicted amidohydrolase
VLAPAQWGAHSPDRASYGRAMVVDPWGVVLGIAPDRPALVLADCDLAQQDRIRDSLPTLRHRRL